MTWRSEAHETLLLLFARNRVMPASLCKNANGMIQGRFYQKLKEVACHLKQLEPCTPWSNTTGTLMKELTKDADHKLL